MFLVVTIVLAFVSWCLIIGSIYAINSKALDKKPKFKSAHKWILNIVDKYRSKMCSNYHDM